MEKIIIAVSGKYNTGKTTALDMLKDQLTKKGLVDILYEPRSGKDFVTVLEYQKRIDGDKRVGIISAGDSESEIEYGFKEIAKYDCDVIVCATRCYGDTTKTVQSKADKSKAKLYIVGKWDTKNNNDTVEHILGLAGKYIDLK